MNLNKKIIILLVVLILIAITVFPKNTYAENENLSANEEMESVNDSENIEDNRTEEEKEAALNKKIEYTEFVEIEKGTKVKDFIEFEKQRRLKEWYADEINEGYEVKFYETTVYAINGTTYRALQTAQALSEDDIVRTNVAIEIGTSVYKGEPDAYPMIGEGEFVATVVKGDLTGKGETDVTDLSLMQEQIVETTQLEGPYKQAADMNGDSSIDVVDLSEIQQEIVNN